MSLEAFNDQAESLDGFVTPRSIEACQSLGIIPNELLKLPLIHFQKIGEKKGGVEAKEHFIKKRFNHYEQKRKAKLTMCLQRRDQLIKAQRKQAREESKIKLKAATSGDSNRKQLEAELYKPSTSSDKRLEVHQGVTLAKHEEWEMLQRRKQQELAERKESERRARIQAQEERHLELVRFNLGACLCFLLKKNLFIHRFQHAPSSHSITLSTGETESSGRRNQQAAVQRATRKE